MYRVVRQRAVLSEKMVWRSSCWYKELLLNWCTACFLSNGCFCQGWERMMMMTYCPVFFQIPSLCLPGGYKGKYVLSVASPIMNLFLPLLTLSVSLSLSLLSLSSSLPLLLSLSLSLSSPSPPLLSSLSLSLSALSLSLSLSPLLSLCSLSSHLSSLLSLSSLSSLSLSLSSLLSRLGGEIWWQESWCVELWSHSLCTFGGEWNLLWQRLILCHIILL